MSIDTDLINALVLVFGGGFGMKAVDLAIQRWRDAQVQRGKRENAVARWRVLAFQWEAAAWGARTIAVQHGVPASAFAEVFDDTTPTADVD